MSREFEKPSETGYTIYTKSACPFCVKAKALLLNESPAVVDCDPWIANNASKQQFLDTMETHTKKPYKTFPMIFHNGEFVGGFDATKLYYAKNQAFTDLGK